MASRLGRQFPGFLCLDTLTRPRRRPFLFYSAPYRPPRLFTQARRLSYGLVARFDPGRTAGKSADEQGRRWITEEEAGQGRPRSLRSVPSGRTERGASPILPLYEAIEWIPFDWARLTHRTLSFVAYIMADLVVVHLFTRLGLDHGAPRRDHPTLTGRVCRCLVEREVVARSSGGERGVPDDPGGGDGRCRSRSRPRDGYDWDLWGGSGRARQGRRGGGRSASIAPSSRCQNGGERENRPRTGRQAQVNYSPPTPFAR